MSDESNPLRDRLALLVPINKLRPKQQDQLLASAEILVFRKKDLVFNQGDRDPYAFYLLAGELEMWSGDQLIKKIVGGEGPSFQPLAQLQPRQMSARATTNAQVLRVDRGLLDRLLSIGDDAGEALPLVTVDEPAAGGTGDWLTRLLQSELFTRIPPSNIQRLLDTLESVDLKAGDVVIQQGAAGDYYYVVQLGRCEVCRATSRGREIRLAELGPGDTFGEEALVSNAKRNATVRMLTDGSLGRLTQADFVELIREPVLRGVDLATATREVAAGARWLDVRFPEEHRANGLPGSLNVPLSLLRARMKELDPALRYIAYCDSGGRSSAAAFLLTEAGFDVRYVVNGAIDEVNEAVGAQPPATVPATPPMEQPADALVDAEVRAQSLAAEVEKARFQIAQAARLTAEAEATKREAERIVQARLQDERTRLDQEAAAVQARLAEAERLKQALEQQYAEASREAERQRAAHDARAAQLQQEIEQALREKEQRLEAVYRKQAQELERLQADYQQARRTLDDTWQQIELESSMSRERLAAAQRLEAEAQSREAARTASLAAREQEMREAFKAELARERQQFEAEFANAAAELSRAREARQAAEFAKQAAAAEARRIIAEYQTSQQQQLAELRARLQADREAVADEAERLRAEVAAALTAREGAERARLQAEAALAEARRLQASSEVTEAQLRADIEALELRAALAEREFQAAASASVAANDRQRAHAARVAQNVDSEQEVSLLLRRELDEWMEEQARFQNSAAHQAETARLQAQVARIKARAVEARTATSQQAVALLDELATKQAGAD